MPECLRLPKAGKGARDFLLPHPRRPARPSTSSRALPIEKSDRLTNTIPLTEKGERQLEIALRPLFGEAIRRISEGSSVSSLFL